MDLPSDKYDPFTGLDHDSHQNVTFYTKKDSEPPDMVYCRIITPGNNLHIHDQPVRDYDKAKFPRHWSVFQMQNNEQGPNGFGTSLEQWSMDEPGSINENQRLELFHLKFQTVEQIAMATDSQVQRMPLGGVGLRENARRYLKAKSRGDADGEVAAMKDQIAQLTALVEKLASPTQVAIRKAVEGIVPLDPNIPPPPRKVRGPNKIRHGKPAVRTRHVEHAPPTGEPSHG